MKLANLSTNTLEKIKSVRWDRIIEKHEGPEKWESVLRYYEPEFMEIEGRWVLLPVEREHHPNITILRSIWSADGNSLTLFLKDTTYEDDPFFSGFIAVCDKIRDENFFLAILYHEWFVIEPADVFNK
ncbi:MAG TPA: hypothetical protein DCL61_08270 [Cyanobacteria bacterium UBA12227]|nr:hypothetical protein [Cyanobacteria bacterium UBA12227]HAX89423.1 hypothetical protein [Cyanobacteria bacterium UBA11370]HBY77858.1 hypothetical protein [Cyanobacteria bacterium UBA11148]